MVQILKQNGDVPYGLNEYIIDTKTELSKISKNIAMGSSVFVVEENKTYILDGKKQWIEKVGVAAGGIAQETDPTVPDWAKRSEKPTYTAEEVGAVSLEDIQTSYDETSLKPISGFGVSMALQNGYNFIRLGYIYTIDELIKIQFKENSIYFINLRIPEINISEALAYKTSTNILELWGLMGEAYKINTQNGEIFNSYNTISDSYSEAYETQLLTKKAIQRGIETTINNRIDSSYTPNSDNAQSGWAVQQAFQSIENIANNKISSDYSEIDYEAISDNTSTIDQLLFFDGSDNKKIKRVGYHDFKNTLFTLKDEGNYFTSKNIEDALQQLGRKASFGTQEYIYLSDSITNNTYQLSIANGELQIVKTS